MTMGHIEVDKTPEPRRTYWNLDRFAKTAMIVQMVVVVTLALAFALVTKHQNELILEQSRAIGTAALQQAQSNHIVIRELESDLFIHAQSSANRTCAIAREFQYFVRKSPTVTDKTLHRVNNFTVHACKFVPPITSQP